MIKYDYEITVNGNQAKLNKDIYLFRGNKNVHYYFAVKNASFNFKGSTDLIEKTNAINAAVTVIKPNNVEVASAIAKVENGKIHLKVTEDLIDEEVEVGDFDLVFDLFDDTDGAVTIPKVIGQFHVLERPCTTPISELVATNTTNEVDQALTDYAIVTYAEPVASTNADGTFAKKTWVAKEKITTAELNRMEEGISDVSSQCKDIANKTVVENGKLYLVRKDGTKIDTGTTLPSNETGTDGREIELQKSTDYIQWRYVGDGTWNNLVPLSDLKGAKGDKGDIGTTPNLQIGTVETLASGSSATASITGTTENPLLNLGIPKGENGTGGSSDTLVTTNISGTILSLTTDKYQTATVVDGTEITLPTVTAFTEIHLFFSTTTDLTLILPSCKWQNGNTPTISANKTYEFIFTYVTEWLGGVIEYGS